MSYIETIEFPIAVSGTTLLQFVGAAAEKSPRGGLKRIMEQYGGIVVATIGIQSDSPEWNFRIQQDGDWPVIISAQQYVSVEVAHYVWHGQDFGGRAFTPNRADHGVRWFAKEIRMQYLARHGTAVTRTWED